MVHSTAAAAVLLAAYFIALAITDSYALKIHWSNVINVISLFVGWRILGFKQLAFVLIGMIVSALLVLALIPLNLYAFTSPIGMGMYASIVGWVGVVIPSVLLTNSLFPNRSRWAKLSFSALHISILTLVLDPIGYHWHLWRWPGHSGIPWWSSLPWLLMGLSAWRLSAQAGTRVLYLVTWAGFSLMCLRYGFYSQVVASLVLLGGLFFYARNSNVSSS